MLRKFSKSDVQGILDYSTDIIIFEESLLQNVYYSAKLTIINIEIFGKENTQIP